MADAYWRVTDGRIHPVSLPPVPSKRPRTENDVPSGPEMPGSHSHNDVQGMHHAIRETDPIETSYEQYLRSGFKIYQQNSSYAGGDSARSMSNGVGSHSIDGPRVMGTVGSEPVAARNRTIEFGGVRPEVPLPPEASSTLFVEGLPANCTRREFADIFRPFVGFKEVRLVIKESRHPGGHPFVLCFVDFMSPPHAATAMDTLQGYKLDEHERDSPNLRLQFARRPGARSGGGYRGKH
uniref:Nucleic acid binding protein n=1 Tax=Solanum tuberosum TaxID=4113 RepID=M1BLA1_SOLTU